MNEKIYRMNERGYMQCTGEKVIRCINCMYYANEIVNGGTESAKYCKRWRAVKRPFGWCDEAKSGRP